MRLLLLFTLFTTSFATFGMSATNRGELPPDSTSSVIDRAAAVLLIDEGKKMLNSGRSRDALTKFRQASQLPGA